MAKQKTIFICQKCGASSPRWQGQCHNCNQWNTFVEEIKSDPKKTPIARAGFAGSISKATALADIKGKEHSRMSTNISEFDRVLGGGIVKGSVTLVGGDPGIGKSSILLQIMSFLSLQKKFYTLAVRSLLSK